MGIFGAAAELGDFLNQLLGFVVWPLSLHGDVD